MTDPHRSPSEQSDTADQRLARSDLYGLVVDEQRRRTIAVLDGLSTPVRAETVARSVAAEAAGAKPDVIPDERAEQVLTALHHNHLPKLADADLVDYDPDERLIDTTADGPDLADWIM